MDSEAYLIEKLQNLQKQLGKKQSFEEAVSSIKSILIQNYPSASPSLRKSIYTVISRVATILQTRYTSPGFWLAGKGLFEEAERLATESSTKEHLRTCIKKAREHLNDVENQPEVAEPTVRNQRYLFEGHLTVDAEPPHPQWLVAQQFLFQMHAQQAASLPGQGENNGTREENNDTREENNGTTDADSEDNVTRAGATEAMQELLNGMGMGQFDELAAAVEASLQVIGAGPSRPPPASKDVVNKLPIITVTKEILERLGSETECAVCREGLLVNDKMQELPCKHLFHPPCLKPWLDEHNSCPICRYELPTDDHAYESQKERDKEAEEDRKGAANAVRGGEFMYV
ncbi:RING-type E3 ubiquitin transferase [Ranunculus cassubicifolius]